MGLAESKEKSTIALDHGDNRENTTLTSNEMRTCFENSLNMGASELRTPSLNKKVSNCHPLSIKSAPMNRKRSTNKGSMNVTNLNILFDSNFVYNSPKSDSDICMNKNNVSFRKRSYSSIPKLRSCNEKPLSINQSTQTNDELEPFLKKCKELSETPKVSSVPFLHKNDINCSKKNMIYGNEININPYSNNKEVKVVNREDGYGEVSLFSPNLLQYHELSSSPIEKFPKQVGVIDNGNDCSLAKADDSGIPNSSGVVLFEPNLNLNNARLSDKSLASLCNIYNASSNLGTCKCQEYNQEISHLNFKINKLNEEVEHMKTKIEDQQYYKNSIDQLSLELKKVNEEQTQFKDIRSELQSIKDQVKCLKSTPHTPSSRLPPPPPPPPLPPPSFLMPTNSIKITKSTKSATINKESKPVISMDDILKVKLKKASDRASYQTPTGRYSSQPLVSLDVLKRVKLQPASRSSYRSSTPDITSSELLLSPHSSLCRLLKNESSTLKRLRKVGGYSYDSVYSKNLLLERERHFT